MDAILTRLVGRYSSPKRTRLKGPKRSEATAYARKITRKRTYLIEGETESPARKHMKSWIEHARLDGHSKKYLNDLNFALMGCA